MKKPLEMDIPFEVFFEFFEETPKGILLLLLVKPGAKKEKISLNAEGNLTLSVAAPPVDNAANDRVRELLGQLLAIPKSAVSIHSGSTSRKKLIRLEGLKMDQIKLGRSDRI